MRFLQILAARLDAVGRRSPSGGYRGAAVPGGVAVGVVADLLGIDPGDAKEIRQGWRKHKTHWPSAVEVARTRRELREGAIAQAIEEVVAESPRCARIRALLPCERVDDVFGFVRKGATDVEGGGGTAWAVFRRADWRRVCDAGEEPTCLRVALGLVPGVDPDGGRCSTMRFHVGRRFIVAVQLYAGADAVDAFTTGGLW